MNEDERLKKFNEEHDRIYTSPPIESLTNQGTPGQAPDSGLTTEQQATMRQMEANAKLNHPDAVINPSQPVPNTPPAVYTPPATVATANQEGILGDTCPQCNSIHPPLKPGQMCPNARINLPSIKDEEIGEFLVSMRNIIISQIEKTQVKDVKKLFQQSIVVLAKFLEEYKEEVKDESNPISREPGESASSSPQNP
jgi:hypothetical protein